MVQVAQQTSNKLSLKFVEITASGQAVILNDTISSLDILVQGSVLDKDLSAPPGSPAAGATYIIASSPTGAWSGHTKQVASFVNSAWKFFVPSEGWRLHVDDEHLYYKYDGSNWVLIANQTTSSPSLTVVTKTADFTASLTEAAVYLIDATAGNVTATLPSATSMANRAFYFTRVDASVNTVTIDGNASETINGATTMSLLTQYSSARLVSNGTAIFTI